MKYEVFINTVNFYVDERYVFEYDAFEEFKTGILKRFGNIKSASNRQMREKPKIKSGIKK